MEFACSVCQYTSYVRNDVIRHINKKKSCGLGIKEIIEIPVEIMCEFCDKVFSTKANLKRHQKDNCLKKIEILESQLKEERQKVKDLEKRLIEKPSTVNNITNNIMINNYDSTSLDKLTDRVYNKILKDADEPHHIISRLIKYIHCNPEIPENHNIRISNRNKHNKYLEVYRNGHWEIEDKKTEIGNLISDKETNISDWIDLKGENYPEALEKFNDYLEQKFEEETANLIKEEVEVLLYNHRNMIKY